MVHVLRGDMTASEGKTTDGSSFVLGRDVGDLVRSGGVSGG